MGSYKLEICFLLVNFITLIFGQKFVRYKKYANQKVNSNIETSVLLKLPERVSGHSLCAVKCNLDSSCESFSFNSTKHCSMYNADLTIFDLVKSSETQTYSKESIKLCHDSDYYADFDAMQCKQKKRGNMACATSDECSTLDSLGCLDFVCQCLSDQK